jgi:MFS family permease
MTPSTPVSDSLFAPGRRAASLGAIALISMLAFEAIAIATAMPAVAAALGGLSLYALAFGALLATSLLGMALAGEWCDKRGAYSAAAAGLAAFLLGLLLAGFAPNMALLVLGRAVQGLGGGVLGVALYVGVGQLLPPALHARMFALFAAAWVLPGLVGPALASGLVALFGWRAVFLAVALAVPVAGAMLLPALRAVGQGTGAPLGWGRLRWAALAALGALALHAAAQAEGPGRWAVLAAGLLLAGGAASRLLPPGSLWGRPGLPAVIALRGLLAAAYASAEAFIPLALNQRFGWSLGAAGVALSVGAVSWSLGSAVQARVTREGARQRLFAAGFALCGLGLAALLLPLLWSAVPAQVLVAGWSGALFGVGLSFPMLSVLTLKLSAPEAQGANASALQLSDALVSSAALAGGGLLFDPAAGNFAAVLALSWALALLAGWVSLGSGSAGPQIRRPAAASRRRHAQMLERVDALEQFAVVPGLLEDAVDALDLADAAVQLVVAGDGDDGQVFRRHRTVQVGDQLEAVLVGHLEVGDQHRDLGAGLAGGRGFDAIVHGHDLVAAALEQALELGAHDGRVIGHQHDGRAHRGRR